MNPPFSNDRLRNLSAEFIHNEEEKYINGVADTIQTQVIKKAYADSPGSEWAEGLQHHNGNVGTHKLKMNIPMSGTHCHQCIARRGLNKYTERIILRLKERFPEMKIEVDPLRTYVLFDWS